MGPKPGDIDLHLRIAKKLAVDLPDEKDRVVALKWLKFLQSAQEATSTKTRLHATQLLLICLQRRRLVGPFVEAPDPKKKVTQYGWAYQPSDMARLILKSEFDRIGKTPYAVEFSGDLTEYVATQDIPQFGAHFYYAFSPENASKWEGINKEIIPKEFLSVSTTEGPDTSILATTIAQAITERKRAAASRSMLPPGQMKRTEFTAASMIDPETGALHEGFAKEVPTAKDLRTRVLEDAMKRGVIEPGDLSLPTDIAGPSGAPGKGKKGKKDDVTVDAPLVETIEVKDGTETTSKSQKLKNAASKKVKKKTKMAFGRLLEEEDEETKAKREFEEKKAEQEAKRQEMVAMMPPKLRKRWLEMEEQKEKKRLEKEAKEKAEQALKLEKEAQEKAAKRALRKGAKQAKMKKQEAGEIMKKAVSPERKSIAPTPRARVDQSFLERDLDDSWDQSYRRTMQRKEELMRPGQTVARREALDRLSRLKAVQPRKIIFDGMDTAIQTEEDSFNKYVFSGSADQDKSLSILDVEGLDTDDIFGEGQIVPASGIESPAALAALHKAEVLLDTEMETDDVFGEDIASPAVVFKEIAVQAERLVSPTAGSPSPREGGFKIGKRTIEIPGQKPMEQQFVEQYGDVVFNESLQAVDPPPEMLDETPPMDDEMLNNYLEQKLQQTKPGESPRVYGPWAQSLKKDIAQLERGEPLALALPEDDRSIYPSSDVEFPDETRRQSDMYSKLKSSFEDKKAEKIEKALAEIEGEGELEPSIYGVLADEKPVALNASIVDAGLGLALVEAEDPSPKDRDLEESLIVDIDAEIFGEDDIAEPPILERKPPSPRKPPSLVRQEQFMFPDEDIAQDFLDQQSFPEDKFMEEDIGVSPVESAISVLTPPQDMGDELLGEGEMETDDIFGQEVVKPPSPVRRVSPTTLALAKTIKQTRDSQNLVNKFRESMGLPPVAAAAEMPFDTLAQLQDARESLLAETREPEILDVDVLPEDEMEADLFADDQIAEPPPLREMSMRSPRKSFGPLGASSPQRKSPTSRAIAPPSFIPDDNLEDELEPALGDLSGREHLSMEDKELLKTLFDGEIPASIRADISPPPTVGEVPLETSPASIAMDMSMKTAQDMAALRDRYRSLQEDEMPQQQRRFSLPKDIQDGDLMQEDFPMDVLAGEMDEIPGGFDEQFEAQEGPISQEPSPPARLTPTSSPLYQAVTKAIQDSEKASQLRNKFRTMQGLPVAQDDGEEREQLSRLAESILEQEGISDRPPSPKGTKRFEDPFKSFEEDVGTGLGSKQPPDALFGDEQIASPPRIQDLPLASPKRSPVKTPISARTPPPRQISPAKVQSPLQSMRPDLGTMMEGEGHVASPRQVTASPQELALERSIIAADDYRNLKNKVRRISGLPPMDEPEPTQPLKELLQQSLADRSLLDEIELDDVFGDDAFASPPPIKALSMPFGQVGSMQYSPPPAERSLLAEEELDDIFTDDAFASPPPMNAFAMPLGPIGPPEPAYIPRPSIAQGSIIFDDAQLLDETPPEIYDIPGIGSPISPMHDVPDRISDPIQTPRDTGIHRSAERQKSLLANRFGLSTEAMPDELLPAVSPPRSSMLMDSPGLKQYFTPPTPRTARRIFGSPQQPRQLFDDQADAPEVEAEGPLQMFPPPAFVPEPRAVSPPAASKKQLATPVKKKVAAKGKLVAAQSPPPRKSSLTGRPSATGRPSVTGKGAKQLPAKRPLAPPARASAAKVKVPPPSRPSAHSKQSLAPGKRPPPPPVRAKVAKAPAKVMGPPPPVRPSVPGRPSLPARSSLPGKSAVPAKSSLSGRPSASGAPPRPALPAKGKVSGPGRPSLVGRPSAPAGQAAPGKPSLAGKPSLTGKQSLSGRPSLAAKPSLTGKQSLSGRPSAPGAAPIYKKQSLAGRSTSLAKQIPTKGSLAGGRISGSAKMLATVAPVIGAAVQEQPQPPPRTSASTGRTGSFQSPVMPHWQAAPPPQQDAVSGAATYASPPKPPPRASLAKAGPSKKSAPTLYLPTMQDIEGARRIAKERDAEFHTPPSFKYQSSRLPAVDKSAISPIQVSGVRPEERGFKWMQSSVQIPAEQQPPIDFIPGEIADGPGLPPPLIIDQAPPAAPQKLMRQPSKLAAPTSRLSRSGISKLAMPTAGTSRIARPGVSGVPSTSQAPPRPPLPAEMRGAVAEMQITKTTTDTTQSLLKKTAIVRKTGLPPPRPQAIEHQPRPLAEPAKPAVDLRTMKQSMMVAKVGKDNAVRKQSTIQMQHDENRGGSKMIKTNTLQSIKPGEVKKLESKFAMAHRPKGSGAGRPQPGPAPKPPPRKK